ncbi:MAG: AAA family ATPase [Acidobacteriota bacterium]
MIHVDRQRVAIPDILLSKRAEMEFAEASEAFSKAETLKGYVGFRFQLYKHEQVSHALGELFADKCAFCEESANIGITGEIEHFRPKANCVDDQGQHFPQHYWWLANTWENLYLACMRCNRSKRNRFPILGERAEVGTSYEELRAEHPLLLDPCADDPSEHLRFETDGRVRSLSERGQASIELFGLNRKALVRARLRTLERVGSGLGVIDTDSLVAEDQEFLALRRQVVERWRAARRTRRSASLEGSRGAADEGLAPDPTPESDSDSTSKGGGFSFSLEALEEAPPPLTPADDRHDASSIAPSMPNVRQEYSLPEGAVDAILKRFSKIVAAPNTFSLEQKIQDPVQIEVDAGRYFFQSRLIVWIRLQDFKAIESLVLPCEPSGSDRAGWTMLLGENGTGKSSVLEAVALTLAGTEYRDELLRRIDPEKTSAENARDLIRRPRDGELPAKAEVVVGLTDDTEATMTIHADGRVEANSAANDARVLLLGYGATRLLPRHEVESRGTSYARVDNLFDPFVPLGDARRWLLDLSPEEFDDLAPAFGQLLGLGPDERLVQNLDEQRIDVHLFDSRVPLEQLSAGYQSVVALVADIISILRQRWKTSMAVAEGVVLLDEIGAHLHPKWRMRLVRNLRDTFPQVQFLISTHDPLCLRGLEDGEVIAMRRDADGRVGAITDLPPVTGLRVDQLLTSQHFGLSSTVDPELEEDFETYYALLLRQDRGELDGPGEERLNELREQLAGLRLLGETRRERLLLDAIDRHLAREETLASDQREQARGELETKLDSLLAEMEL